MKPILRYIILIAITGLFAIMLTGCWGRQELEDLSLVTLMGIDNGLEMKILVTVIIDVPGKITENGNNTEDSSLILSAEGESVLSAFTRIERMSSRSLTSMHLSTIILGEDFARTDVGPIIDIFSRDLHFRHDSLIAVCKGTAQDFLSNLKPREEPEPWLSINKIISTSYNREGSCPRVTIHDFSIGYSTIEQSPWTPYLELSGPLARESKNNVQSQEHNTESAREIPVVKILGSAIFALVDGAQKMVDALDPFETMSALLMSGTYNNGYLTFALPGGGEPALIFIHHTSVSQKVHVEKGRVTVIFHAHITGSVAEVQAKTRDIAEEFKIALISIIEEQINAGMRKTFEKLQQARSDVIDLGMNTHGSFSTWREWEEFDWQKKFTEVSATFKTHVQIHEFGFIFNPIKPR